jgi:hypothetical protein
LPGNYDKEHIVSKKKGLTEEEQLKELVTLTDTSDIDDLIDPEDIPGAGKKALRSGDFTDGELSLMPSYTKEELKALPEPWTKRGEMLAADKRVITALAGEDRMAARIFVTGEVEESYIGEAAVRLLINANDVYYSNNAGCEPLFINTREGTVRMARFDPTVVWRWFHPGTLAGLVGDEAARIGVDIDPWKMNYFDFYQNMVAALKALYGEDIIMMKVRSGMNDFYHGIYLACLLLFGKAGYMDVPAAAHFARKEAAEFLRSAVFLQLKGDERKQLEDLRKKYGGIKALTNPEMNFVVDLYERTVKWV